MRERNAARIEESSNLRKKGRVDQPLPQGYLFFREGEERPLEASETKGESVTMITEDMKF